MEICNTNLCTYLTITKQKLFYCFNVAVLDYYLSINCETVDRLTWLIGDADYYLKMLLWLYNLLITQISTTIFVYFGIDFHSLMTFILVFLLDEYGPVSYFFHWLCFKFTGQFGLYTIYVVVNIQNFLSNGAGQLLKIFS